MDLLCFCSVLCLLSLYAFVYMCLWSPAGKGLTSWLSFVVSNCNLCYFFDFFRFQGLQSGYCRCKYVYIKSNSDPYCIFMCLNTDARFLIYFLFFYHHFFFFFLHI